MHPSFYLAEARNVCLRDGKLGMPQLYIDFSTGEQAMLLVELQKDLTVVEQCKQLFYNGQDLGEKHAGKYISQLTFVSEAWTGETIDPKSEDDPEDALIVCCLDFSQPHLKGTVYAMRITRQNNLIIALDPAIEKDTGIDVNTSAFYEGYLAGAFSPLTRYLHRFFLRWAGL